MDPVHNLWTPWPHTQIICAMLVLIIAYVAHEWRDPYESIVLDSLERRSLLTTLASLFLRRVVAKGGMSWGEGGSNIEADQREERRPAAASSIKPTPNKASSAPPTHPPPQRPRCPRSLFLVRESPEGTTAYVMSLFIAAINAGAPPVLLSVPAEAGWLLSSAPRLLSSAPCDLDRPRIIPSGAPPWPRPCGPFVGSVVGVGGPLATPAGTPASSAPGL
jgi:hypothetical protein